MREQNADIVDEHFYRPPKFFYDNVHRYDNYPRTGPKVFAGEYAAHVAAQGRPDRRPLALTSRGKDCQSRDLRTAS